MSYESDSEILNRIVDRPRNIVVSNVKGISMQERLDAILASANKGMHSSRQVLPGEFTEAVQRAFSKYLTLGNQEEIELKAFREINNFLVTATTGRQNDSSTQYFDLLQPGHPLSESPEISGMSESELKSAQADWISGDPRIAEEYRPLVASAFKSESDSVERKFLVSRLSSLDNSVMPRDIALSLLDY